MKILVLGSAAGGGFPQWNCHCPVCQAARMGKAAPRTQSSIAVSTNGETWFLITASPDLRQQVTENPALHPYGGEPGDNARHSPIGEDARAALIFKCGMLWAQLDALHHAYVTPGLTPPGAFLPEG